MATTPQPAPTPEPENGAAERELASYRLLAETAEVLLERGSLEETLERVADALAGLVASDALAIYEADAEHRVLRPLLVRDRWAVEISESVIPFGHGGVGWVADHAETLRVGAGTRDPRVRWVPGTPDSDEPMLAVPLVVRAEVRGVLVLNRDDPVDFNDQDELLCRQFANQAALAIDNARVHDYFESVALHDSLTGLWNHRHFHEELRDELKRGHRYGTPVSLVLIDIDDFKTVNDRFGHLRGDEVLRELAELMRGALRETDVACRLGGEEFAIIAPSTDAAGAAGVAERVRRAIEARPFEEAGAVTISAGVATMPRDAHSATELIEAADQALYASKRAGKNRVTGYEQALADVRAPGAERPDRGSAELAVLESLAHKVASLADPRAVAGVIAFELRTAIDFHHCRVLLLDEGGEWLEPVAVAGDLIAEGDARPSLRVRVGGGIAGSAVALGRSVLVDDVASDPRAIQLPGTAVLPEESLLAVPMRYDQRSVGVIVLSKLGLAQFGERDRRLVEIVASHAAAAFANAALGAAERRANARAAALLELTADGTAAQPLRRRLHVLRRAIGADWVLLLRAEEPGGALAGADAVASRSALARALAQVALEPRPEAPRLTRLARGESERLPAGTLAEHVVRLSLDPDSVLLAGANSPDEERELRAALRELATHLARLLDAAEPVALAATARPEAQPRVRTRHRRLGRIALELPAGASQDDLMRVLAEHARTITGADEAGVARLDPITNTLRFEVALAVPAVEGLSLPVGQVLAGEAIRERRSVVFDDCRREHRALSAARDAGLRSLLVVPIEVRGVPGGTLSVASLNRPLRFTVVTRRDGRGRGPAAGRAADAERALRRARVELSRDRRGAHERARAEGCVHVGARARDQRAGPQRGADAAPGRAPPARPRVRGDPPRHRQDRRALRDPHEGRAARRGRARADRAAHGDRPRPDQGRAVPATGRHDRALVPRALGRQGLPGPPGGRGDPARGAHHPRLRRLARDALRPPVPQGAHGRGRARRAAARHGSQFDPRVVEVFVRSLPEGGAQRDAS